MPEEMHVLDLLPAYVFGSLEADEASRVKKHLLSCWSCRTELNNFQNVTENLSFAAPIAVPSPDLKSRLFQRVQATRSQPVVHAQTSRRPWLERLLPLWGFASLALIIALIAFNAFLWQRFNHLEFTTAPGGMLAFPLSALNSASNATGFMIVSPDGKNGALVVDGLPTLNANQQYQLWLIRDNQRTSAAVFSMDEENYLSLQIESHESLLEFSTVNITIEPAGGSPQPTGEPILSGPLFK